MEGRSLFDLSQLLEYCSGDYSPDSTLKRISDKYIRVCGRVDRVWGGGGGGGGGGSWFEC